MTLSDVDAIERSVTNSTGAFPGYQTNLTRVRITAPFRFDYGSGIVDAERAAMNIQTSISDPLLVPGLLFGATSAVLGYSVVRDTKNSG